jgi:predicted transcriptional regulator
MQHRGEIVEKIVRESGYSITKLATKLGKSRRWMYLAFENRNLSIDVILQIGSIIHYDFSTEISDLTFYTHAQSNQVVDDSGRPFLKNETEAELWKNKYLDLLEKYNLLLLEKARTKYPLPRSRKKPE